MAFLDFIKNRGASPAIEGLPAEVKTQAVEAARPAAAVIQQPITASDAPVQPQATPNAAARGRSLSMDR